MRILLSILFFMGSVQVILLENYQAKYKLVYRPDSINLQRTATENFMLLVNSNGTSSYTSDNFFRSDSIKALVKNGTLSEKDYRSYIMSGSNNRHRTNFRFFLYKNNLNNENKIYESIGLENYVFFEKNILKWGITTVQDSLLGYHCTKAITSYAGRDYEAWFTPEIPIADGPYIFGGLPGLIVKLNDTRNHYTFTLTSFNKYAQEMKTMPTYLNKQPFEINRDEAFSMREEYRKDGLGYISRTTGHSFEKATITRNGVTMPVNSAKADRSWDNNPLELK